MKMKNLKVGKLSMQLEAIWYFSLQTEGLIKKWKNTTYFPENVTKETSSDNLLKYTTVFPHLQTPSSFSDIIFYIVSFYSLYLAQLDREMILKTVKT